MSKLGNWLKTSFWPGVAAGEPIQTKNITKRLEPCLVASRGN